MEKQKPQLLSPAGDWPSLLSAVNNGADSVYFGVKGLNMRNLATNFDRLELKKIINYLHSQNKKGYLALNVLVFNQDLATINNILKYAQQAKVDAIIAWDMAVLALAKKMAIPIHLSTQASVANIEALNFYVNQGVKRIILARECSLKNIIEITSTIKKDKIPCEIETFIHGAMCISISGRCFLSHHSFNKSANRGECLQPCRRKFTIKENQDEHEYILGDDYILSAKDLCSIEFIDKLIEAKINSFKIEGRNRSPEYVAVVTKNYRKAIDSYFNNQLTPSLKKELLKDISSVYTRGFSKGFYFGQPEDGLSQKLDTTHEKIYLGYVTKFYKKVSVAEVFIQKETLHKNDTVLIIGKTSPAQFAVIEQLEQNHLPVTQVKAKEKVGVKLPFIVKPKDRVFLWRKK